MNPRIEPISDARDLEAVRTLFREYAGGLEVDLAFQGFPAELATLPGRYAPPAGALLLARDEAGAAQGCVGLRPLDIPGACEVKRLYVRAAAQGTGLGRALATRIVAVAAAAGYRRVLLDTLPSMRPAIALYRQLGFAPIAPYWNSTVPGVLYFGKELGTDTAQASGA